MKEISILMTMKQSLQSILPSQDQRTEISPYDFVVNLMFCFRRDTKLASLEGLRRTMKERLRKNISRSAFWERLSRKRLNTFLTRAVSILMTQLCQKAGYGTGLLKQLGVSGMQLVDSSSFTLWDGLSERFPGTLMSAGIKWHACFNLLSGTLSWFEFSSSASHDRHHFPKIQSLQGQLTIFDLGYWDYSLLLAIERIGGFFLSRVKSNAVLPIAEVISGLSPGSIGKELLSLPFRKKRQDVIEVRIEKPHQGQKLSCRAIGFWNQTEHLYHFYLTNLRVPAAIIYPLYRLRGQIELIFKSNKSSLNADPMTSNNPNIIENLLLASLAGHLASSSISSIGQAQLKREQKFAISFQRVAKIAVLLAEDFVGFFLEHTSRAFENLLWKIRLFADEIFDPNYKHRETSLMRLQRVLDEEIKKLRETTRPHTNHQHLYFRRS